MCVGPPKPPPKTTPLRLLSSPGAFPDRSARGESLCVDPISGLITAVSADVLIHSDSKGW